MRPRLAIAASLGALLLVGAGCGAPSAPPAGGPPGEAVKAQPSGPSAGQPGAAAAPNAITAIMRPKGGNDEVGTATFTATDDNQTRVVISLRNAETRSVESAGVYGGTCKDLAAPLQYDLNDVARGSSTTTLNVNLSMFKGGTKQSVRVLTKPVDAQSTFWTCGDIN